mmetsp:Transcript_4760/g.14411  ORF Transcript_4760/g.14411 Transcript_4760/m.14411 type:complete len:223 (-) Transcript_4760:1392-2060(-)|eukprot:352278-Chlamydomonas_euryale.AAC.5
MTTELKFYKHGQAKKVLGVSDATLRLWADTGAFPSFRTPGGTRLYQLDKFLQDRGALEKVSELKEEKQKICYCRVSSSNQKDDLQRQIKYMQDKFPDHKIITDIGSGINFKRPGLRAILELSGKGVVSEVVVAYRDRLCRFAFDLIEWILRTNGVKLMVLNESLEGSEQSELAEDLLSIITVFNCKIIGKRKYTKKEDNKETTGQHGEESGSETDSNAKEGA